MHRKLVLLFLIFVGMSISSAQAASEEDLKILDTYNQYSAAIIAAKLCDKTQFKDTDEEAKFQNNFLGTRSVAAKILKKIKPNFTNEQIVENVKAMDISLKSDLENRHKLQGCSDEFIKSALGWFENFKRMPPMPE